MTRAPHVARPEPRRARSTIALAAASAAVLLAAPGCAFRLGRSDSPPSLRFATETFGDRMRDDARATADWFGGLPSRVADDVAETPRRLRTAGDLYFGD